MNFKKQQGFTLVELAIVMIIIGLLIGGVLKGQQLIENAKVKSVVAQVKSYQAAALSFKDSYAGIPGDMSNAALRLAGCQTGNTNSCTSGNGNSIIGNNTDANTTDVSGVRENTQFWKHLALADLITGVQVNANPNLATDLAWGAAYPASKIRGGFAIIFNNQGAAPSGHYLRMQPNATGGMTEQIGAYPVSPIQAAQIDRIMDDSIPITGSVITFDAGPGEASGCEGQSYDTQKTQKNCLMFFNIGL